MFSRTTEHMQKLQDELKIAKDKLEATNLSLNQSITYAEKNTKSSNTYKV